MNLTSLLKDYWPLLALAAWFYFKWKRSRQVIAMLPDLRSRGATFVDVRSAAEFAGGNAPESINIPLQELSSRLSEIPKTAPVIVACASGTRSAMAKRILKGEGYADVHNIGTWTNFLK